MIEIIQDVAPEAEIFFAGVGDPPGKSVDGARAFIESIDWFVQQGVDIIVDDIGFFSEPFFSDGPVAAKVASIVNSVDPQHDILFVSAAGNSNGDHYQEVFRRVEVPEGDSELQSTSVFHQFADGQRQLDVTIPPDTRSCERLRWFGSEP